MKTIFGRHDKRTVRIPLYSTSPKRAKQGGKALEGLTTTIENIKRGNFQIANPHNHLYKKHWR